MNFDLRECACFGVAGNFTGHLEQAGEAKDFVNVKAEEGAPKAVFPTYIPGTDEVTPSFLHVFPFNDEKIDFPAGEEKLQIEPECAIICKAEWKDGDLSSLTPVLFGASNDCSIRKEGARKISQKKNWGPSSKGLSKTLLETEDFAGNAKCRPCGHTSKTLLETDGFTAGCKMHDFRIASFLVRDGRAYAYGEDSPVRSYSYIYEKLIAWLIEKVNHQQDEGPAEPIHSYLAAAGYPSKIMFSIGATRYTQFGETNFLQPGDEAVVVVYPESKYSKEEIQSAVQTSVPISGASVLRQRIN